MRLFLVEDDPILGDGLHSGLTQMGYRVEWARDAETVRGALGQGGFDLLLLDLGLPGEGGLTLLQKLRSSGDDLPVLIITARDSVQERVSGLDSGADDYLVKPFDLDELAARIRAVLRRRQGRASPLVRYQEIELDPAGRLVRQSGVEVALTHFEFVLLESLLGNSGRVMTRERLEELLYGWDENIERNTIEVHMRTTRIIDGYPLIPDQII